MSDLTIDIIPKDCADGTGDWVEVEVKDGANPVHVVQHKQPDTGQPEHDSSENNAKIVELIVDENHVNPTPIYECSSGVKWVCEGETDEDGEEIPVTELIFHAYDGNGGNRTRRGKSVRFIANDSPGSGNSSGAFIIPDA